MPASTRTASTELLVGFGLDLHQTRVLTEQPDVLPHCCSLGRQRSRQAAQVGLQREVDPLLRLFLQIQYRPQSLLKNLRFCQFVAFFYDQLQSKEVQLTCRVYLMQTQGPLSWLKTGHGL